MKKIFISLLILGQMVTVVQTKGAPLASTMATQKSDTEMTGIKKFSTLKEAGEDYAKALQEISNYGSREMLKTINPSVDQYVNEKKDEKLAKKWEESNTMLIEQFEVSVHKINENQDKGEVIFLIKGYDEEAMNQYLNDNSKKYAKVNRLKGEVSIDIEKYIELQHEYLSKTKKINLATSTVNFVKENGSWKVLEDAK